MKHSTWKANLTKRCRPLIVLAACVGISGCGFTITADDFAFTVTEAPVGSPSDGNIRVILTNATSAALDVHLFVSAAPLSAVPTDLFVEGNLMTAGIGLGGNGRLGPSTTDSIEVPCAEELTLGTSGGDFIDAETGDALGNGAERWVIQGAQFDCGDIIVIEYRQQGDDYETSLALGF